MKCCSSIPSKFVLLALLLTIFPLSAQKNFDSNSVIAPPILAMDAPKMWEGEGRNIGELNIPVSTNNELVQKHVRQGFELLHAQWDVEAYRHFAAAVKSDPDCLMAYCGVVMSLLNPQHEWKEYRARAINRMVSLAEHKSGEGEDAEYVFPANERDYAIAIGSLVVNGMGAGAASFEVLAEKYPNDLQLSLLAPFFNRGKYDVFGNSDEKQERAVRAVKDLLDENPDNPLVTNFYIMMQIEAPSNAVDQAKAVLPFAKKLVEQGGADYPGWQMILGYAAWRTGGMELARDSFQKAASLYEAWKKESKAGISECDGLIRAYSFLALVHFQMGDTKNTEVVLKKLAEGAQARKGSSVYAMHSWSHQMIRVNMFLADGDKEAIKNMLKNLPKVDSNDKSKELFNLVIKGYQAYGLVRSYKLSGEDEESIKMLELLGQLLEKLSNKGTQIRDQPYRTQYLLLVKALKVYHLELTAEIVGDVGAYSFFQDAIDQQIQPTLYFPPNILYPMEYKLAEFYERKGDLKKARETYELACKRMPSHPQSRAAYERLMQLLEK
ncbi:MAG: tetratricopeptide (TPR) repeat protein [Rubritalea sp.]|jgi:tetratricopeptide (TPR) repeat protein